MYAKLKVSLNFYALYTDNSEDFKNRRFEVKFSNIFKIINFLTI